MSGAVEREVDAADRMSEQEALMWNVEKDPWLNPSGGAVFVLDQPIHVDRLRRRMRKAVAGLPRLYERVQPGFGRLSTPAWVPDPEFDFDYHFRVMRLPTPGTERQLLDLAARLYTEPLDRTRPLWRMVVIEGLESGEGAMWSLIHHSISDGIGQLRMAEMFQDLERDAPLDDETDLESVVAQAVSTHQEKEAGGDLGSSVLGAAAKSVGHVMRRGLGTARRAVGEVAIWPADPSRVGERLGDATAFVQGTVGQLVDSEAGESGAPLWRERSRHRHLERVSVPLEELKTACKATSNTINEGFLAVMAQAAVDYHSERGEHFDTLNVSFVVSTREGDSAGGNAFTPVPVHLPATKSTVRDRLPRIHEVVSAAREQAARSGGIVALSGVVNLLPTSVVTRTARAQAARIDIATSNLRGAPFPLYVAGSEVKFSATMGPLAGTPCNATALSYRDSFDVGLFIDPVAIREPAEFRRHVADAFDELLQQA